MNECVIAITTLNIDPLELITVFTIEHTSYT